MAQSGPLAKPRFAPEPDMQVTTMPHGDPGQPEGKHVTRRPREAMPFLVDGDLLDVKNDDSKPVTFRWARRSYTVEPGESGFVPFEALVNSLGDPRSVENQVLRYDDGQGNRGQVMTRYDELCRLFAYYAVRGTRTCRSWSRRHRRSSSTRCAATGCSSPARSRT